MKRLHELRFASLTHIEAGQFVKRNLTDFATAEIDLETDTNLKNFTTLMKADTVLFDQAILQNQKNGEAQILEQLDSERDKSYSFSNRYIKAFELSDIPAEVVASKALRTLFSNYKNLTIQNYETETNAINQLLQSLNSPEYAVHVETLSMENQISRLQRTNNNFSAQFSQRNTETAVAMTLNVKTIRSTMTKNYVSFANYVVAMANTLDTPAYNNLLDIINTNRKYYSDMLARRQGSNKAPITDPTVN